MRATLGRREKRRGQLLRTGTFPRGGGSVILGKFLCPRKQCDVRLCVAGTGVSRCFVQRRVHFKQGVPPPFFIPLAFVVFDGAANHRDDETDKRDKTQGESGVEPVFRRRKPHHQNHRNYCRDEEKLGQNLEIARHLDRALETDMLSGLFLLFFH